MCFCIMYVCFVYVSYSFFFLFFFFFFFFGGGHNKLIKIYKQEVRFTICNTHNPNRFRNIVSKMIEIITL